MVAVAVAALVCVVIRGDASPGLGIALIATSLILLTWAHHAKVVALRRSRGLETSRLRKAALLPGSLAMASVFVGLSDLAFLIGYLFYRDFLAYKETDWRWDLSPDCTTKSTVFGAVAAVGVASVLRTAIWPCEPVASARPSWNLRSKARVVAVLLASAILLIGTFGVIQWRRYCMEMAEQCAQYKARASHPSLAAAYDRSKRWYQQAASRPWMVIDYADEL
jgi:hypothetical protein